MHAKILFNNVNNVHISSHHNLVTLSEFNKGEPDFNIVSQFHIAK